MQILKKQRHLTWFLQVKKIINFLVSYKDDGHKIRPLRTMAPKVSAYVKIYDGQTKKIHFFISFGRF